MRTSMTTRSLALGAVVAAGLACLALYSCYFVTDFDKKWTPPDTSLCDSDDDCRCANPPACDVDDPSLDCEFCNVELGTCVSAQEGGFDEDGDGWPTCAEAREPDCNDTPGTGSSVYPDAEEQDNGIDDDCDGIIDDGTFGTVDPQVLARGCDTDPFECSWSGPVAVLTGTDIGLVWESNEGASLRLLRASKLTLPGTLGNDHWVKWDEACLTDGGIDCGTFNMTDPSLADSNTHVFGVWVDHLGGKKIQVGAFERSTLVLVDPLETTEDPTTGDWSRWDSAVHGSGSFPENAAVPVVAGRPDTNRVGVAWSGGPSGDADIHLAIFEYSSSLDRPEITGEVMNASRSSGVDETTRPAIVAAYNGYAVAWAAPEEGLRIVYWQSGSMDSVDVTEVDTPGLSQWRDPVLVRSHVEPEGDVVILLFAATPSDQTATEVYALAVDLSDMSHGTPLRVSNTVNQLSADVSGAWYRDFVGIAWSDRGAARRILFRRIAVVGDVGQDLTLASSTVDVSEVEGGDPVEGQDPTIVAFGDPTIDQKYAVVWWTGDGDLYVNQVSQ